MHLRAPSHRILINVLVDAGLALLATPLGLWIALSHNLPDRAPWYSLGGMVALMVAGVPFRLSQQYWRFVGLQDLLALAGSSFLAALLFSGALAALALGLPSMSFPLAHALAYLLLLGAPRTLYRLVRGHGVLLPGAREGDALEDVLLIGSGLGADMFLRAIATQEPARYRVIGIVALGARHAGHRIHGVPILGALRDLPAVLDRLEADGAAPAALVVTDPSLGVEATARLLEQAERRKLGLLRATQPSAQRLAVTGRGMAGPAIVLKPLVVEDLLDRPQQAVDREGMARLIQGRRVLVTGAGGTIGSELAKQVAALGPELLILLDNGEYALWQIELELSEAHAGVPRRVLLADVRDEARIRAIMQEQRPHLVFHAAALKHVPMVEANPLEGLLTNAVGTRHVADAARAAGAAAMVLISTDKAVNPTSVMGASKRLAEKYCQALDIAAGNAPGNTMGAGGMRCITVRFGNVLGSTGSVVPLFCRQLERGGPLTVTHPDMRRYFMTVREAVGLVLQASVVGTQERLAEAGGIFVLDMGPPVKIVDLARQMIRLAGLRPDLDVEIRYTGMRPGEKLHEEIFHGREPPVPTAYPGLLVAAPRTADPAIVGRAIQEIATAARAGQEAAALAVLAHIVPEFEQPGARTGAAKA